MLSLAWEREVKPNMKRYKAYQVRLYPTLDQQQLILKTFGCTRFVYNYFLSKQFASPSLYLSSYGCHLELSSLKKTFPWLKEVDSAALYSSTAHLDVAFARVRSSLSGMPRYKRYGVHPSFTSPCTYGPYKRKSYASVQMDCDKKLLKLPKLHQVKYRGYRSLKTLPGKIKSVTVRMMEKRFYVSILVEEEIEVPAFSTRSFVGLDLGLKDIVVTSEGKRFSNPKPLQTFEKKLRGLQRGLVRKEKGSHNYIKMKDKISRLYLKIRNARKYYFHLLTNQLVQENDCLFMEHLHSTIMMQNKRLAKSIGNASFYALKEILTYKCLWANKRLIQVSSFYPSSQLCSNCGHKNSEMKDLGKRVYHCEECGAIIDRDVNASLNILKEGIDLFIEKELKQI